MKAQISLMLLVYLLSSLSLLLASSWLYAGLARAPPTIETLQGSAFASANASVNSLEALLR